MSNISWRLLLDGDLGRRNNGRYPGRTPAERDDNTMALRPDQKMVVCEGCGKLIVAAADFDEENYDAYCGDCWQEQGD